jgi:uncharacterized cupredoxin-like copper-binding protein
MFIIPLVAVVVLLSLLAGGRWSGVAQEATPSPTAMRCPSPLATPVATPAASPMATPSGEPVCVAVREGEFSIDAAQTTFQVGVTYIFAIGNEGTMVHEFVIEPAGATEEDALEAEVGGEDREAEIEDIAPGQTMELEWTFTEPGRYQFACHLADHFEQGMVIEIEVTG